MKICCLYRVRVFHTNFGGGPFRRQQQQQQQQQRPQQPASPIAQLLQFVPILLLLLWTFMQMPSAPVRPPLDPLFGCDKCPACIPIGETDSDAGSHCPASLVQMQDRMYCQGISIVSWPLTYTGL